ncbi:MAG: sulfurtransferase TusA family protein [Planctomycetes bacterium]|nr:sulfurtransferase TusA family protein [Planctomycetota bacterium]
MTDPDDPIKSQRVYDAGTTLCGELALELRAMLREMQPGDVLEVVANDSAAPQDLPAWCDVTGHALVRATHPHYWIRRKAD